MSELFKLSRLEPELRFPKFSTPWVERRGGELFFNSRKKGEAELPIYSVTQKDGLVPRDSLDRRMEGDAADESNLRAQPGDLVYNMMRMWQGAVGLAKAECMVSPAYVVLAPKLNTEAKFFLYNLGRKRSLYNLWAYSYGLTNDRLRLYFKDFAKIKYRVPKTREEQTKIADFLQLVDQKREKLFKKRELLEKYKRGLIQKMFSQEIRFKMSDGCEFPDWKEMAADKIFRNHSNKEHDGSLPVLAVTQNSGVVNREDLDIDIKSSYKSVQSYKVIEPGDFVISLRSFQGGIEYSRIRGISSPAYTVLKPIIEIDDDFYKHYFKRSEFIKRLAATVVGIRDGKQISYGAFSTLKLQYPCLSEQKRIAECLNTIDCKVEAVSKQAKRFENFKKGLLQKMFV
jgi:type I restriction enzyme S subunit